MALSYSLPTSHVTVPSSYPELQHTALIFILEPVFTCTTTTTPGQGAMPWEMVTPGWKGHSRQSRSPRHGAAQT